MAMERQLAWSAVIADMKLDRIKRDDIREELMRYRPTSGPYRVPLAAWRRQDGVREIFQIFDIGADHLPEDEACVYLAVNRPGDGTPAKRVAIRRADASGQIPLPAWLRIARDQGANELHVSQLCDTPERRTALIDNLFPAVAAAQVAA